MIQYGNLLIVFLPTCNIDDGYLNLTDKRGTCYSQCPSTVTTAPTTDLNGHQRNNSIFLKNCLTPASVDYQRALAQYLGS